MKLRDFKLIKTTTCGEGKSRICGHGWKSANSLAAKLVEQLREGTSLA
jgi:hypothetical protein